MSYETEIDGMDDDLDGPSPAGASEPPISTAAPISARLLRANLSFSVPSFWSGAALFIIVYVIGFVGVLAALDLFPDLMQLMFGPQGK